MAHLQNTYNNPVFVLYNVVCILNSFFAADVITLYQVAQPHVQIKATAQQQLQPLAS